jgi:hypothetical protein
MENNTSLDIDGIALVATTEIMAAIRRAPAGGSAQLRNDIKSLVVDTLRAYKPTVLPAGWRPSQSLLFDGEPCRRMGDVRQGPALDFN